MKVTYFFRKSCHRVKTLIAKGKHQRLGGKKDMTKARPNLTWQALNPVPPSLAFGRNGVMI